VKQPDLDSRIDQVAALSEPVRRALYHYVARQAEPASREQAAAAVGVALHVAKFHLDRLVADGLLAADYRRPPGRGGPGAGRPAKMYRSTGGVEVSVPERRYDLAGTLLVRAVGVASREGTRPVDALADVARAAGRDLARDADATTGRRAGPARRLTRVLESCGFEPATAGPDITLHNCPFHRLAEEDQELVCAMNLSFVRGVLDGIGAEGADARLDPVPGGCCVRISRAR
jgi:predicted ArsR family transcriptional regulator